MLMLRGGANAHRLLLNSPSTLRSPLRAALRGLVASTGSMGAMMYASKNLSASHAEMVRCMALSHKVVPCLGGGFAFTCKKMGWEAKFCVCTDMLYMHSPVCEC